MSYRLPTWLVAVLAVAVVSLLLSAFFFWLATFPNEMAVRHGLPEPLPHAGLYALISLVGGLVALVPLSFHINYWEERSEYSEPRCPYCEKLLPAGDEARELHRIRHALERIETVLTDLVSRVRA
jgi:hypothetical protein